MKIGLSVGSYPGVGRVAKIGTWNRRHGMLDPFQFYSKRLKFHRDMSTHVRCIYNVRVRE